MALCFLAPPVHAAARTKAMLPEARPLSWECVVGAAQAYNLPLAALVGILATEGGKTGQALSNTNAYAAAWVLRKEYDRTRNIWDAVGAYHSRTPHLRNAYLGRVKKHLAKLERVGLESLLLRTGGAQ